ncbi:MAG: efflux RND transporter periplasmic adaptor subunit [Thermoguttaceae bacterium]
MSTNKSSRLAWRLVTLVVVVTVLGASGYGVWSLLSAGNVASPPEMIRVLRERFVHQILERGNVESAQNVEIRCEVESPGGLTIISLVPEGTSVKKGDLLVELDASTLAENVTKQRIVVSNAMAAMAKSEADLRNAELSLKEYTEGKYLHELKVIDDKIFVAREEARLAEDNVRFNQKLLERGYLTESQAEADVIAFRKATNARESAELEKDVLTQFTYEKNVRTYTSAVASATAKANADRENEELEQSRLRHLQTQLERCRIVAPQDGQVVYFISRWGGEEDLIREGKKVFERQILMRLPDPTQMQVKGLVNEASIRLVKTGQKATVRLEAFPNRDFDGVVERVNDYPEQSGGGGGATMSREYQVLVRINDAPEGIKPGLTAEVLITVNEIADALVLPVQAVFQYNGKSYCMTYRDGVFEKHEIEIGATNDKKVVIASGLEAGDEVVLGAWQHRKQLHLPEETKPKKKEEGGEQIKAQSVSE